MRGWRDEPIARKEHVVRSRVYLTRKFSSLLVHQTGEKMIPQAAK